MGLGAARSFARKPESGSCAETAPLARECFHDRRALRPDDSYGERLSHKPPGPMTSCRSVTRSRFCIGSFRSRKVRFGRLQRSCEVGEKCHCHFRTTALVCATASRQCRSEGRAAETPEIVPRRSRRERGRRRLLLWASSSHGACWCEPPAFRASSLLAVVASLPCTRSMHVRVRPIVATFDWAGVLAGTEDTAALGACVRACSSSASS